MALQQGLKNKDFFFQAEKGKWGLWMEGAARAKASEGSKEEEGEEVELGAGRHGWTDG